MPGRLVILDVDAKWKMTLLYSNQYSAQWDGGRIQVGSTGLVPGSDYSGFTSFEARDPIDAGKLIALVAP
jgi:hypothetical protein